MAKRIYTIGISDIDRRLELLASREAAKVVRSAVGAGLTLLAKNIRQQVDTEPGISRRLRAAIKRTVGKRFVTKSRKFGEASARAGFSVAKKQPATAPREGQKGVGVSAADVHWFALGTDERQTGMKKIKWQQKLWKRSGKRVARKAPKINRANLPTGNTARRTGRINPIRAVARAMSGANNVGQVIEKMARKKLEEVTNQLRAA